MTIHQFGKPRRNGVTDYRMRAQGGRGEVWLYGLIGLDFWGDGVTAKQFADDLKKLGNVSTIDLRLNSDGGVVTDARAMYNLLVEHKAKVHVHIDGIAASAASFLAMAGDEIEIAEGGFVMIHNAYGVTKGQAEDHRRMADVLDAMNGTIRKTYCARTGNSDANLKKWMDAETWFDGNEAVANGFADRIVPNNMKAAAVRDPERFANLPAALQPREQAKAVFARLRTAIQ